MYNRKTERIQTMYYVPDGTRLCCFYEGSEFHSRFLSLITAPSMICPACGRAVDYEIGPDEEMPELKEDAKLVKIIEGEEEVEKYDTLLSLAITGGDYEWI